MVGKVLKRRKQGGREKTGQKKGQERDQIEKRMLRGEKRGRRK